MKYLILLLNTLIYIISPIFNPAFSDESCLKSIEFPLCIYTDKKLEFIIFRNEKEVGWHNVVFEISDEIITAETNAYVKAPYLLVFDYVMEYHSVSKWHKGKLINLVASLNDDGDEYEIRITKDTDGKITISGKEEKFIIEENILPTEHWHPEERNASKLINTLNGEIVNVISTQIDEQTWYLEGDIKYEITYDKDLKWTGLKFNADEDDIIEYICKNCK